MLKDKFKTTAQDKKEEDLNGFWLIPDNPMTKIGVFPYLGRQISAELEPDRIYQVLRPEEELTRPETLKSLELIPLTNEHEMLGKGFTPVEEKGCHGTTGQNVKVNGNLITNDLKLLSEEIKNEVESGKKDLSMGYRCRYELTEGEFEGQHYDAIQRDIIFNHIALVDEGRMGSDVRVMDSFTFDSIKELTQNKENDMADEEKKTQDEDKREIIREVMAIAAKPNEEFEGGEEEKIDTITKKLEALAYNPSEAGNNDEDLPDDKKDGEDEDEEKHCGDEGEEKKDDEPSAVDEDPEKSCGDEDEEKKDEEEKPVSMDAAIKYIARRDNLIKRLRPVIGDNAKFPSMTIKEITKYACDKLDIKNSYDSLDGYLRAENRKLNVRVSLDSAFSTAPKMSNTMQEYLK